MRMCLSLAQFSVQHGPTIYCSTCIAVPWRRQSLSFCARTFRRAWRTAGRAETMSGQSHPSASQPKTKRDEIWEQKRRARANRQQGQPAAAAAQPPPQQQQQVLSRMPDPQSGADGRQGGFVDEHMPHPRGVTFGAVDSGPSAAAVPHMPFEQADVAPNIARLQQQQRKEEYAAALQRQQMERAEVQRSQAAAEPRHDGSDEAAAREYAVGVEEHRRRQQQAEYARALQQQMAEKQQPRRRRGNSTRTRGHHGAATAAMSLTVAAGGGARDDKRRQQMEYAQALEQRRDSTGAPRQGEPRAPQGRQQRRRRPRSREGCRWRRRDAGPSRARRQTAAADGARPRSSNRWLPSRREMRMALYSVEGWARGTRRC